MIAADVIALRPDPKFDTMIISRGSGDGLKNTSVVVTRSGLVGRVFEVEPGTAAVLMLTDQKSGVGARIQRPESRAVGLCEGDNSHTLSMIDLNQGADVKVGDAVVTSGLGGIFPAGILIGSVCEVSQDPASGGRTIRVQPHVGFDSLEQVYVIP
jgi:rod shape-determining protein MreC